ncbi:MAG: potassium transporter KefB [Proteobacteria bacterium]|nr:potassium transporter KefB [Pseudomonadota bacterium]NOG61126.1 potassium transporter KefB [Pseudomonadota bacterium]
MDHSALNDGLILLALSVIVVWGMKRLKLPPILGYLLVGTLVGSHALGWLPEEESIRILAEIGVVFLLFMIGLEFSLSRLIAMKSTVFGLGSVQVIISTLSGGTIAWLTGIDWRGALVVGGALALSSTAIVAKQLTDQLEMQSRHGQLAISILLFQDLAVVPLLVIIPILTLSNEQSLTMPLLIALSKGLLAFFIMFQIGRRLLRPFYHLVAGTQSAEMFTLATLFVSLTAAWLTHQLGLSLALGAFLAGLMLSETEYKYQVQADIRPFRDVLMGLFFISVGAQLDVSIILREWFWIGLLTAGLLVGKGAVIAILTRIAGYKAPTAFRTGLLLGQAGEFSFAVLVVAISNNLLTLKESQPIIAATLLSMLITPVLIRYNSWITERLFRDTYTKGLNAPDKELVSACETLSKHVIICGFGRIGQNLANILREMRIPYVALDLDHSLIREAWEAGENVFFGDSTHAEILEKAEIERGSTLIITFDDAHIAEHVIQSARSINENIPIVVRSKDEQHMDKLHDVGASNVVPESFEASMMLAIHVLQHLNISTDKSMAFVEQARKDEYRRLRGYFRGEESLGLNEAYALRLHTILLLPDSYAVGKSINSIDLKQTNTLLISVRRGKERIDTFNDTFKFNSGDAVVIEGTSSTIINAEKKLLAG